MELGKTAIRLATPGDAQALLDIYAPYVRETAITFEWEVPNVEEFAQRIEHTLVNYPYLVAERGGAIVGYTYTGRFGARKSYDWCAETSIYIAQSERRHGAGRLLYEALEKISRAQHLTRLMAILAAAESDDDPYLTLDSPAFHERMGYRQVGRMYGLGHKFGRWYGDFYYEKEIGESNAEQPAFVPFSQLPGVVVDDILATYDESHAVCDGAGAHRNDSFASDTADEIL